MVGALEEKLRTHRDLVERPGPGAGGVRVGDSSFLAFPANVSVADLPPLSYAMGGQNFTLTAEQYLIPRGAYSAFNITDDGRHYSWFGSAGFQRDAILGQAWLQYFYSIYDVENKSAFLFCSVSHQGLMLMLVSQRLGSRTTPEDRRCIKSG